MKPTTSSVFAPPVRLQLYRNRFLYGNGECATGAQVPRFPPTQDGHAKSVPKRRSGRRASGLAGRAFFVSVLCLLMPTLQAQTPGEPAKPTALTGNASAEINATGNISTAENTVSNPPNTSEFNAEQIKAMRLSCRDPSGSIGPAMVLIKPGHFMMGSDDSDPARQDNEMPKHSVTIPRPFAVSRCEISVGQFRQFIDETGTLSGAGKPGCYVANFGSLNTEKEKNHYWDNPGFEQSDLHPVACVSYNDAQAYVRWLSQRTGADYRLLTEAEWEYVARAKTTTPRYYGAQSQCGFTDGADQATNSLNFRWTVAECNDGFAFTAPVANFKPNAYGLFDVLGNVWEWTADCWHKNYQNAPQDGSQSWGETDQGECASRVVRGGSWFNLPNDLRAAFRGRGGTDQSNFTFGFRIARNL